MTQDHYQTLGVSKDSTPEQIKKAYRKLAMKWHPDRNPNNKEQAEKKFKDIGEAYSVLSDEQKRKNYDQFGTDKPQQFEGFSGNASASTDHPDSKRNFSYNNAQQIFEQFFHNFGGAQTSSNKFDGFGGCEFDGYQSFGGIPTSRHAQRPRKGPTVQCKLALSLEELFFGRTKTLKITRQRLDAEKRPYQESKNLTIDIKPGWKAGTKVTFQGEGDEAVNVVPGDIQFVIEERKHDRFERDGNDLVKTVDITLKQALCGVHVNVVTLDQRRLKVPVTENTIHPGYVHRVRGEGMPVSKTDGAKRGDLKIKFNITFPRQLNDEQKQTIQGCL